MNIQSKIAIVIVVSLVSFGVYLFLQPKSDTAYINADQLLPPASIFGQEHKRYSVTRSEGVTELKGGIKSKVYEHQANYSVSSHVTIVFIGYQTPAIAKSIYERSKKKDEKLNPKKFDEISGCDADGYSVQICGGATQFRYGNVIVFLRSYVEEDLKMIIGKIVQYYNSVA